MTSLKSLESGWRASGTIIDSGQITKNICSSHYLDFEWRKKPYKEKVMDVSMEVFLEEGLWHAAVIAFRQSGLVATIIFLWFMMMQALALITHKINPYQDIYFDPTLTANLQPFAVIIGLIFCLTFSWQALRRFYFKNNCRLDDICVLIAYAAMLLLKILLYVWIFWIDSWMQSPHMAYNIFLIGQFSLFLILGVFLAISFGNSSRLLGKDLDFTRIA